MKRLLTMLAVTALLASFAHAGYNERGMKTYIKLCKKCHGGPFKGAAMKKSAQWEAFFETENMMFKVHENNEKATKKLSSGMYENRRADLSEFLINNARDMGSVPGCDANYCGK